MNNKRSNFTRIYFIGMAIIIIVMLYYAGSGLKSNNYKYNDLLNDLQNGKVTQLNISQNKEVPTGKVTVKLQDGSTKYVYITDVNQVISDIKDINDKTNQNIQPSIADVSRDSVFLTNILPMLLMGVVIVVVIMMMNANAAGGNSKMANFGKSRAKMVVEVKNMEEELRKEILEFYFTVRDFLNVSELVDENYVVYTEKCGETDFRLRLFCVNPAVNLGEYLKKGKSTVFFSATLFPMLYYRELLTTDQDAYGIYVRSPFPIENRQIMIGCDVSSKYTRRNYSEYRKLAEYIARCVWQRQGNYMIFFPSYKLMEDVYRVYEEGFSAAWVRCIRQSSDMTERAREEFLEEFQSREGTLVGFCVLGGIFSEGVDLTGESLIGVVIVGTGLPQIGSEREILREYYNRKNHAGFDYAYRYPGMNKVLQAAGRVIRTKEDKGVILLLDDRFLGRDYEEIFPREWRDRSICRLDTVEGALKNFWKRFT